MGGSGEIEIPMCMDCQEKNKKKDFIHLECLLKRYYPDMHPQIHKNAFVETFLDQVDFLKCFHCPNPVIPFHYLTCKGHWFYKYLVMISFFTFHITRLVYICLAPLTFPFFMGWLVFGLFSVMNFPMLVTPPFENSVEKMKMMLITFQKRTERIWMFLFGGSEVLFIFLQHFTSVEQRVMWILSCPLIFQIFLELTMTIRIKWLNILANTQIKTSQVYYKNQKVFF